MLPELKTAIPGPRSLGLAARLKRVESRNVTYLAADFPVFWERAEGTNVWDADDNRFLDLTSAFAVCGLGHRPPEVVAALHAQADRLLHAMGDVHPPAAKVELCEMLAGATFGRWGVGHGKVLLANSGSEAVEAALKTSLLHSGKPGVICFTGGYHGLGHGALETSGIPFFRDPFRPQLGRFGAHVPYPHCYRCPFGTKETFRLDGRSFPNCCNVCLDEIRKQIEAAIRHREIGCILVEPIQGRGGDVVPPLDFLRMLREICDQWKILLVLDEIYTGFNRTGKLFACDHAGVIPDLICLGKGLASGFPLSACVGRSDIMDAWPESRGEALHTSTFLGHPVGCAMAVASLREHLLPETAARAARAGENLRRALADIRSPAIGNLRGVGAMLGLELVKADRSPDPALAGRVVVRALSDGILLLAGSPDGNVLSFSPPFDLTAEEADFAASRIQEYIGSRPGEVS